MLLEERLAQSEQQCQAKDQHLRDFRETVSRLEDQLGSSMAQLDVLSGDAATQKEALCQFPVLDLWWSVGSLPMLPLASCPRDHSGVC